MRLSDIVAVTHAKPINEVEGVLEQEFDSAFASDLMSDVLCYLRDTKDQVLLITGLTNLQVIHTADTIELKAILIVRGKQMDSHVIDAAKECGIAIYVTEDTLFEASGKIYQLR